MLILLLNFAVYCSPITAYLKYIAGIKFHVSTYLTFLKTAFSFYDTI